MIGFNLWVRRGGANHVVAAHQVRTGWKAIYMAGPGGQQEGTT
jgi:hypothetical protein